MAQYIADMLLELRKMAKAAGLKTLLGCWKSASAKLSPLPISEIPPGEIEKLRRLAGKQARGDLANRQFQRSRKCKKFSRFKIKTGIWLQFMTFCLALTLQDISKVGALLDPNLSPALLSRCEVSRWPKSRRTIKLKSRTVPLKSDP